MKYAKIEKGERQRVRFGIFNSDEEAASNGYLPIVTTPKPEAQDGVIQHNYKASYLEQDGTVVLEWIAYPNYEAISKLKKQLDSSDYKIIKCYEASLVGKELPYDMTEIHAERQEIRDEINRLEACE